MNQPFSGVVGTFTVPDTSAVPADFDAQIQWGDEQSVHGTITGGNGSFTVTGSHTFTATGVVSVVVAIVVVSKPTTFTLISSTVDVRDAPGRVDRTLFPDPPDNRPPAPPDPPAPVARPPVPSH